MTRILSQRYDAALRAVGLTITQFTILQALSLTGEISQGGLGEILAMDSTTLTRTLSIMAKSGWIISRQGADRRKKWQKLSAAGRAEYDRAFPHWQNAQTRLRAELGEKRWKHLTQLINQVTASVAE